VRQYASQSVSQFRRGPPALTTPLLQVPSKDGSVPLGQHEREICNWTTGQATLPIGVL